MGKREGWSVLKAVEEMGGSEETKERAQVIELLSSLAEIQSSREVGVEEIKDILTKLKKLGDEDEEAVQVVAANIGDSRCRHGEGVWRE